MVCTQTMNMCGLTGTTVMLRNKIRLHGHGQQILSSDTDPAYCIASTSYSIHHINRWTGFQPSHFTKPQTAEQMVTISVTIPRHWFNLITLKILRMIAIITHYIKHQKSKEKNEKGHFHKIIFHKKTMIRCILGLHNLKSNKKLFW